MNLRKVVAVLVAAFVVFYAIANPHETANAIHAFASGLGTLASDLAHRGHR